MQAASSLYSDAAVDAFGDKTKKRTAPTLFPSYSGLSGGSFVSYIIDNRGIGLVQVQL